VSDRGAFLSWVERRLRLLRIALWPPNDSGSPTPAEPLAEYLRPDGRLRLTLYRRPDGRYGYGVDRYWIEDIPECGYHDEYWSPDSGSGLFDSADSGLREAALLFPWILPGEPE
jgi:hypothetical protein